MAETPYSTKPNEFLPSDTPMVGDGGRVRLSADVRKRAGWERSGDTTLTIIIELVEPECVELHLLSDAKLDEIDSVRKTASGSEEPNNQPLSTRREVDDMFQAVNFRPRDGRIDLPRNVLSFLGIRPVAQKSSGKSHLMANDDKVVGENGNKKEPKDRYGGQQVYVQAGDRSIAVTSLAWRERRLIRSREELREED